MALRLPIISSVSKLPNWFLKIKDLAANGKWKEVLSCHHELKEAGIQFTDPSFFPPILKACSAISFQYGKCVHASLIKQGLDSFTSLGNSIIDFYVKSGALSCANDVFDCMRIRDSVSWNIIIHGHFNQCAFEHGLGLFFRARSTGFKPNISTLVLVILACRELHCFDDGQIIHAYIILSGFWAISSVQNSLLCMYADFGIEFARRLFDEMHDRDVISWSIIIRWHVQNSEATVALELFRQMVSEFLIEVDGPIMITILKACTNLQNFEMGNLVHGFAVSRGLKDDMFVGNSLVDFYSKCDDVDSAFKAFNEIHQKNVVSWNSLLSGYVQSEKHSEALLLFDSMRTAGVEADEVTFVNLLQVCKFLTEPYQCKLIHSKILRQGHESNELVNNSLIEAYAKCNCIGLAWKQFSQMKHQDAVTWSTMIAAFTYCDMPGEAIAVFREMKQVKENLNTVIMLNLFEACSLFGELKISKSAHGIAVRHDLASEVTVGTAVLDMYSKCGAIESSRTAFEYMPQKNVVSWSAMIAAYGMNGLPREALSLHAEMESQGLKPNLVTMLSLLSGCSHGGLVDEGLSVFENLVQDYGAEIGLEHYSCLVDLLARAGKLDSAINFIDKLPCRVKPSASAWSAILSACRNYGHSGVGAGALARVLELEPSSSAGYLLASNMYASGGLWSKSANVRLLGKKSGAKVRAGYSLVHVNNRAYRFVAGDRHNLLSEELCIFVEQLHSWMKIENRDHDDISETRER
ncbi:hypothetical protein ACH5RR_032435 [Cinchona calisaya]|uniref:Pentatricopeptide repeat-containing protein n=1 Tax=Cinchona calisaya TaxID=153742 RepID=A0ABD2YJ67_9GENT